MILAEGRPAGRRPPAAASLSVRPSLAAARLIRVMSSYISDINFKPPSNSPKSGVR